MAEQSVINELNKLKKSELIDIIIYKRLPNNVIVSELLDKFLLEHFNECDDDFQEVNDEVLPDTIASVQLMSENKALEKELALSNKLVTQLEKRCNDQELIINLLKEKCDSKVRLNVNKAREETDIVVAKRSIQKNSVGVSCNTEISKTLQPDPNTIEEVISTRNQPFTERHNSSQNKKFRNKIITGSSTEQNCFGAADKKAWLYVGRAKSDTKPEHVKTYLETKFPKHKDSFTVEPINVNKDMPRNNMSFKVGVNFTLLEEITKPDIWPNNIIVRRFNFKNNKGNFMKTPKVGKLK